MTGSFSTAAFDAGRYGQKILVKPRSFLPFALRKIARQLLPLRLEWDCYYGNATML